MLALRTCRACPRPHSGRANEAVTAMHLKSVSLHEQQWPRKITAVVVIFGKWKYVKMRMTLKSQKGLLKQLNPHSRSRDN